MESKVPIHVFAPPSMQASASDELPIDATSGTMDELMSASTVFAEGLLKVEVEIEGRHVDMLIDTGASRTVFDHHFVGEFAELHALDSIKTMGAANASIHAMLAQLKHFRVGDLCISNYLAAVIDLSHINQAFIEAGKPPIAGLIGLDFLNQFKARIDLSNKYLRLSFSKKMYYCPA